LGASLQIEEIIGEFMLTWQQAISYRRKPNPGHVVFFDISGYINNTGGNK